MIAQIKITSYNLNILPGNNYFLLQDEKINLPKMASTMRDNIYNIYLGRKDLLLNNIYLQPNIDFMTSIRCQMSRLGLELGIELVKVRIRLRING